MTWVLLSLAVILAPAPGLRRAPQLRPSVRRNTTGTSLRFDLLGAAVAFMAPILLLPLPWGPAAGAVTAVLAVRVLPREFSKPAEQRRLQLARQLPDAVDLLAALLRAGLTDVDALTMVCAASDEPVRTELAVVARHRQLGAAPAEAWRAAGRDPQLVDLASSMARHADTGAPVAAVLDRVASDARRAYFSQAQAAARACAVRAVIPLAACFLPAFVLLGIVPVVASLFSGLSF